MNTIITHIDSSGSIIFDQIIEVNVKKLTSTNINSSVITTESFVGNSIIANDIITQTIKTNLFSTKEFNVTIGAIDNLTTKTGSIDNLIVNNTLQTSTLSLNNLTIGGKTIIDNSRNINCSNATIFKVNTNEIEINGKKIFDNKKNGTINSLKINNYTIDENGNTYFNSVNVNENSEIDSSGNSSFNNVDTKNLNINNNSSIDSSGNGIFKSLLVNGLSISRTNLGAPYSFLITLMMRNGFTDFSNLNFSGVNLAGVNIQGINLSTSNLTNSDITSSNLNGSNLNGTNLTSANLTNANFTKTTLSNAILTGANITNTNFATSNLTPSQLNDTTGTLLAPTQFTKIGNQYYGTYPDVLARRAFNMYSDTFTSIRGTGETDVFVYTTVVYDDEVSSTISLGFGFQFGSQTYTTIKLSTNGVVFFGSGNTQWSNILANLSFPAICAYWDDLFLQEVGHYIVYKKVGIDFIIEYKAIAKNSDIFFQIILQENTNKIYLKFRSSYPESSQLTSGTIGYFFSNSDYYSYNPSANQFITNTMFSDVNSNEFPQPLTIEFSQSLKGANISYMDLSGNNLTGYDLTNANLTGANLTGANLTSANLTGANLTGANLTNTIVTGANLLTTNFTNTTGLMQIKFDDLPPGTFISNNYNGLQWENFATLDGTNFQPPNTGYTYGVISTPNVTFGASANPSSIFITNGKRFYLSSCWATAAWNNGNVLTVKGYDATGVVLYTTNTTLSTTIPTKIEFPNTLVTKVIFSTSNAHFAMDNLIMSIPA